MKFDSKLKTEYEKKIKQELMKELDIKNVMAIPKLDKIVVNVGMGEFKDNNSLLEQVVEDVTLLAGQKPIVTMSKKAISNFKIRENVPLGVKVTLRGYKMWNFIDKLINIVLPRVKDFRGVSPKAFDGNGNYSIGFKDQMVFPEIDSSKVMITHGLQVIIGTTTNNDDYARVLLSKLGMPFKS
jgi:large subunit ribosomal protein L5